jgi:methyltransferase
VSLGILLLGAVTLQRAGELIHSRHNTRRLLARGAVEIAPGHYPLIVVLHTLWILGLWVLAWDRPLHSGWAGAFVALQLVRGWILWTLSERWTTRIIVLPGAPLVRSGPYRLLDHPNYAVVATEIAVLPLAFGLVGYALLFTMLNAALLGVRIRAESRALRELCGQPTGSA